jgi:hypothetical protein
MSVAHAGLNRPSARVPSNQYVPEDGLIMSSPAVIHE